MLTALSSLPAGENEDAEHTNENVLDVRVIIHDDSHYAHPRKERGRLAYDMPPVQKQLPGRIKPPIINLHGSKYSGKGRVGCRSSGRTMLLSPLVSRSTSPSLR